MIKSKSVFGIYRNRVEAEKAVVALKEAGFLTTDISVLLSDKGAGGTLEHIRSSESVEGAAAGAGTGALIGGTLGLLAGIGALAIPGAGPFIAAGPIMGALAGIGVGGAVGGISGALIGLGIPEYEAKQFEHHVSRGKVLLSVHTDFSEWTTIAEEILEQTGAEDIAVSEEVRSEIGTGSPSKKPENTDIMKNVGTY